MNKIKLFFISAVLITGISASAQKTGYINLDQVVGIMPEVARVDSMLQKYQADSLNPQFAYMVTEYNRKDSLVNSKDSLKTPSAVRATIKQELEGMAYQIQNWQQIVQNALQGKQSEILEPIYRKAMTALNATAKEGGYTHVYNKEALLVAPPGDDLLPLVAKKLNLKIPTATTPRTATVPRR